MSSILKLALEVLVEKLQGFSMGLSMLWVSWIVLLCLGIIYLAIESILLLVHVAMKFPHRRPGVSPRLAQLLDVALNQVTPYRNEPGVKVESGNTFVSIRRNAGLDLDVKLEVDKDLITLWCFGLPNRCNNVGQAELEFKQALFTSHRVRIFSENNKSFVSMLVPSSNGQWREVHREEMDITQKWYGQKIEMTSIPLT